MDSTKYILSVCESDKPKKYSADGLSSRDLLQAELKKRGVDIRLADTLKGGVISQVYSADLDGKSMIVKHTENVVPFDPTELFIDRAGHNIDTKILKLLHNEKSARVPQVFFHFPDITTTVMEDVRTSGFTLFSDQLSSGKIVAASAGKIARALVQLAQISRKWKKFTTNESAKGSIYERGLELRLVYPNSQSQFIDLEKEFVDHDDFWVWPDGHPKNIFIDKDGNPIFIDFGRSHWGDQRYMLPNFLAHIVIFGLAGNIEIDKVKDYVVDCTKTYGEIEAVDEDIFCRYLAMEVLHRGFGKWIGGIERPQQKLALIEFGLSVFDRKITSVSDMLALIHP